MTKAKKEIHDWASIIRDYENGMSKKEITEKYQLPKSSIANKFNKIGIKKFRRNLMGEEQKEKVLSLYKDGLVPSELHFEVGASMKQVQNFIKSKIQKGELFANKKSGFAMRKISKADALEIRKRKQIGDLKNTSFAEIAKEYDVSIDTIEDILNYKTHISDIPVSQLYRIRERLKKQKISQE